VNSYNRLETFLRDYSPPLIDPAEINRLKMLLLAVERDEEYDSNGWFLLAFHWLEYFADQGLNEALRCQRRAEDVARTAIGFITAADGWGQLAAFDPAYLQDIRRCLLAAERQDNSGECLAFCAGAWHRHFGDQERDRVVRLLKKAEEQCAYGWEVEPIIQEWVRLLGKQAAKEQAREFLLSLDKRPEWSREKSSPFIAKLWLDPLNDGHMYGLWLRQIAGRKRAELDAKDNKRET